MGFFSRDKGKKPAAIPEPTPTEPSPETLAKLDHLMSELRAGAPHAMDALWKEVFNLSHWHFFSSFSNFEKAFANNALPAPFIGEVDGRPMVFVFTSSERVTRFGLMRNAQQGTADRFVHISKSRDAAITYLLQFHELGVRTIIFDHGVGGGYFTPLTNLVPMLAYFTGDDLATAARRLAVDPILELGFRFTQTRQQPHADELFREVFTLQDWIWFDDELIPDKPILAVDPAGQPSLLLFTSLVIAEAAAKHSLAGRETGKARFFTITPAQAVQRFAPLWAVGLKSVTFNSLSRGQFTIELGQLAPLLAKCAPRR